VRGADVLSARDSVVGHFHPRVPLALTAGAHGGIRLSGVFYQRDGFVHGRSVMSVIVYPRLGELLAARHLSVSALEREIEARFGRPVNPKTLYRLTQIAPVQRADLEVAGAAAAILGVGLDDLFRIEATPVSNQPKPTAELGPEQSTRMMELFARRAEGLLTEAEQRELAALVDEYGRRLYQRQVQDYAARHGLGVEQARQQLEADLAEAVAWWRDVEANPARQRALVARLRRQRAGQRV